MGALILILSGGRFTVKAKIARAASEASAAGLKLWGRCLSLRKYLVTFRQTIQHRKQINRKSFKSISPESCVSVYSLSAGELWLLPLNKPGCTSGRFKPHQPGGKVIDEGMYYVPAIGEEAVPDLPVTPSSAETGSERVNINLADQAGLETLTGIGPVKAQRIIEYRDQHGGFQSIEEIMNVTGIGEKTFENIRDQITIR